MRKVMSLVLVLIMVLGCISLVACGGEEKGVTTPEDSEEETSEAEASEEETSEAEASEEEAGTPSGGDGLTWKDMPVYSGAGQIARGAWAIPPAEGDWSKVEWRYYEINDTPGKIAAFYKSQMPENGWQEMMWMDAGEMSWGFYQKNDEQDGAMVWVAVDDGNSVIALMRATQ